MGNHWFVMGGNVTGGQVFGSFPSLVLGGADDADPVEEDAWSRRLVPTRQARPS